MHNPLLGLCFHPDGLRVSGAIAHNGRTHDNSQVVDWHFTVRTLSDLLQMKYKEGQSVSVGPRQFGDSLVDRGIAVSCVRIVGGIHELAPEAQGDDGFL